MVSSMVYNVDANTPLVLYFYFEWMDEYANFVVTINLLTPCFSIYYGLHEFLVHGFMIDPLVFMPHSVTPHV